MSNTSLLGSYGGLGESSLARSGSSLAADSQSPMFRNGK
jgi:hypothetical protein